MTTIKKLAFLSTFLLSFILIPGCGDDTPQIVDKPVIPIYKPANYTNINNSNSTVYKPEPVRRGSIAGKVVVVDAGHGGKDPGAGEHTLSRIPEKTIVLEIAREVRDILVAKGAKVIMTRDGDYFLELEERAAIAERSRADLFISIHADSCAKSSVTGATFYTARQCKTASRRAAGRLDAAFSRHGVTTRGLRKADYKVLVQHSRPAVLVECGYLTNRNDSKLLNTSWYQDRIGRVIAEGIVNYFN